MTGRPPKADRTQDADKALEQWLQGQAPDLKTLPDNTRARLTEALGDSVDAIDQLN